MQISTNHTKHTADHVLRIHWHHRTLFESFFSQIVFSSIKFYEDVFAFGSCEDVELRRSPPFDEEAGETDEVQTAVLDFDSCLC